MKRIFTILAFSLAFIQVFATNPVVSSPTILGEALYNSGTTNPKTTTLTGFYTYSDADHHADASTFKWYAGTLANGSDKAVIAGATAYRYEITAAQSGKYIFFEVTAKDANNETGNTVLSSGKLVSTTTIANANISDVTRSSGTTNYLNVTMNNNSSFTVTGSGTVVNVHGDFDLDNTNSITINVQNGATLNVSGAFITKNTVTINVDATSTFTIESGLVAKNGSALTINGIMEVNGDVSVEQNATFTIATGGSLDIAGDLVTADNGDINIEGSVDIGGNLVVGANTSIDVDMDGSGGGTLNISGDLIAGAGTTLNGYGDVTVGGTISPTTLAYDNQINWPLPVKLTQFYAKISNNIVTLYWATASETNNDYFMIEKSADGRQFVPVARVNGAGNSSQLRAYSITDREISSPVMYYRLRQTDFDGAFSFSNIIVVKNAAIPSDHVNVYPNPAVKGQEITLSYSSLHNGGEANITLSSAAGRVVFSKDILIEGTAGTLLFDVPFDISSGLYLLKISGALQINTKILIK